MEGWFSRHRERRQVGRNELNVSRDRRGNGGRWENVGHEPSQLIRLKSGRHERKHKGRENSNRNGD
jgi:hypothetical protein